MESKHAESDSEDDLPSKSTHPYSESKQYQQTDEQDEEPYNLTNSVASKLCDYLYMDDKLSDKIEAFVEKTAKEFEDAEPGEEEFSLEHMSMYKRYTILVEDNLEEFANEIELSPSELMAKLSAAIGSRGDLSSGENLSGAILALTSFAGFAGMMRDFIRDGVSPCVCPPLLNSDGELEFS